jgi:Fic family protein
MSVVLYHSGLFPPPELDWPMLLPLIGPATAAIARYDGLLGAIPNASLLLSPLTTQEAVFSSRIEGTQATMGEVLEFEAGAERPLSRERRDDIHEIRNYRRALRLAEERLGSLPLSVRLLHEVHATLLEGSRGHGKAPGELRAVPNWIGPPGCTIEAARFVPIGAHELPSALGRWERYLHEDAPDRLVQLAVAHAEFEALHPYLDGNGRIGRMLIPLFLWQCGLLRRPMFYMSAFFEADRDGYYERLLAVSRDRDWTPWVAYFLRALRQQAESNEARARGILALYEELKPKVVDWTRSQHGVRALDWLFSIPIFMSTDFLQKSEIPAATGRRILRVLCEHGVLQALEPGRGRRAGIFVFPRLLNIAEGRDVF